MRSASAACRGIEQRMISARSIPENNRVSLNYLLTSIGGYETISLLEILGTEEKTMPMMTTNLHTETINEFNRLDAFCSECDKQFEVGQTAIVEELQGDVALYCADCFDADEEPMEQSEFVKASVAAFKSAPKFWSHVLNSLTDEEEKLGLNDKEEK
jgi:hypothetical protein